MQVAAEKEVTTDSRWVAAHALNWEDLPAEEVVRRAGALFGDRLALTVSFGGAAGMVLLDLTLKHAPHTPVLLIDTGALFDETYRTVEEVERFYGISVQRIRPRQTLAEQAAAFGERLWEREPDRCCQMRKVEPLAEALKGYRGWMTAIRRDQTAARGATPVLAWSAKHNLAKMSPLAGWTSDDVWLYVHKHVLPYNPLLADGYKSLGCKTCTKRTLSSDDRSGRWAGFTKTECGLHI
ncbi:MAG TPA: phosphoadenylyl-sulfate reductase [Tepidisphaeraceae bacterium]|nr:phosphoadenylyl-sulfate reductase [Tepidisphaeraceae bacterium]